MRISNIVVLGCAAVFAPSEATSGFPALGAAEPVVLYVATDGDDRWSGRLESPAADRSDGFCRYISGRSMWRQETNPGYGRDNPAIDWV